MRRLLCIGDSNTWGYDPRSPLGGRYPADVRWTGRLPGWEVCSDGQNGREIPDPGDYPDTGRRIAAASCDVAAVMLGTNDLLRGVSAAEAAEKMEPFLRYLLGACPGTVLLLIAPPPFQPGDWVTSRRLLDESSRLAVSYAALARKTGVAFADAGLWGVTLAFDGVHFTSEGHAAFAAGLRTVIDALFVQV
jgi:Lysophospholipase L1 and related esterases